jgi:hypothetical protein
MPDAPTVHIAVRGEGAATRIYFDGGDSEDLILTPLGDDLYVLEESSLLGYASYKDVIRARRREDGDFSFISLERPSGFVMQSWPLTQDTIDSSDFGSILEQIMAVGGHWERAFGGLLLVHTPEDRMQEITDRIKALTKSRT